MKRPLALIGLLLCFGFQWPAPVSRLTISFLQTSESGVSPGIVLLPTTPEVRAVDQGEIVYFSQPSLDFRRAVPRPNGQWIVVEHEAGVRSVSMGLWLPESLRFKQRLQAGERIGEVTSLERGLRLMFLLPSGRVANPLDFLPNLETDATPRLTSLIFRDDREREYTIYPQTMLPVGFYEARAVVLDQERLPSGQVIRRPLRSWRLTIDSVEVKEWRLSEVEWGPEEGPILVGLAVPLAASVRGNQEYSLGRVFVNVGLNTYEVSATGFNGRTSAQLYRVVGRRP